jgi:hypothetical protein
MLVLVLAALVACGSPPATSPDAAPGTDAAVPDAGGNDAALPDAGDACAVNRVPLYTTVEDGVADTQAVIATLDGEEVYLGFDSGSPMTFVFGDEGDPEFVPDAATLTVGCVDRIVDAIRFEGIGEERLDGRRVVGVLGLDFFEDAAIAIDYPRGELVQYRTVPPEIDGATAIPIRGLDELRIVADAELDGESIAWMVDTGAPSTILVGVEGREGDEEVTLQTADGRTWTAFVGDGLLALPGEAPRLVPIMRAPALKYVEETVAEVGARGLLGMTSIGWRKMVIDLPSETLYLFPLEEPPAD